MFILFQAKLWLPVHHAYLQFVSQPGPVCSLPILLCHAGPPESFWSSVEVLHCQVCHLLVLLARWVHHNKYVQTRSTWKILCWQSVHPKYCLGKVYTQNIVLARCRPEIFSWQGYTQNIVLARCTPKNMQSLEHHLSFNTMHKQ